jgi:hypothetical protein
MELWIINYELINNYPRLIILSNLFELLTRVLEIKFEFKI